MDLVTLVGGHFAWSKAELLDTSIHELMEWAKSIGEVNGVGS